MTEQSTHLSAADQRTATRAAQALADQHQATVDAQRREIERLTGALADCQASYALLRGRGWLRRLWAAVKGGWR